MPVPAPASRKTSRSRLPIAAACSAVGPAPAAIGRAGLEPRRRRSGAPSSSCSWPSLTASPPLPRRRRRRGSPRSIRQTGASMHQVGHLPSRGFRSIRPARMSATTAVACPRAASSTSSNRSASMKSVPTWASLSGRDQRPPMLLARAARAAGRPSWRRAGCRGRRSGRGRSRGRRACRAGSCRRPSRESLAAGDRLRAQLVVADQGPPAVDVDPVDARRAGGSVPKSAGSNRSSGPSPKRASSRSGSGISGPPVAASRRM